MVICSKRYDAITVSSTAQKAFEIVFTELEYWDKRAANLRNISDQLKNIHAYKISKILDFTNSAYFPSFKNNCENTQKGKIVRELRQISNRPPDLTLFVITALEEAENVALYLKPLRKHFQSIEDVDFTEIVSTLKPLFHVMCLFWSRCEYYCTSVRIINLLRMICNLFIQQVGS